MFTVKCPTDRTTYHVVEADAEKMLHCYRCGQHYRMSIDPNKIWLSTDDVSESELLDAYNSVVWCKLHAIQGCDTEMQLANHFLANIPNPGRAMILLEHFERPDHWYGHCNVKESPADRYDLKICAFGPVFFMLLPEFVRRTNVDKIYVFSDSLNSLLTSRSSYRVKNMIDYYLDIQRTEGDIARALPISSDNSPRITGKI